ncbi:MAG TPA: metallopeptidase TldD-related protein [Acetobacteraceae bacterium]|nr:metallopeptidase TldD-related protein [Acetobacteraceae bacterium]
MSEPSSLELLADLLAKAKAAGADAADAVLVGNASLSLARRLGRVEHLERAESRDLGLRVFVGKRAAIVSTGRVEPGEFAALAAKAVAMARVVPEDPHIGLGPAAAPPDPAPLDLVDPEEPSAATLIARAAAAEDAALAVPGVTNSEGAEAGWGRAEVTLATSAGFAGFYVRTSHSLSATALAGSGTDMQRDYDYSSGVHLADLEDPAVIGANAGRRAVARLKPRRPPTARLPVIYEARVAGSLLGHFAAAINGATVARGTSFLKDRMGSAVFRPEITIRDDPTRPRGLRSRPFDGEGIATSEQVLIENGTLRSWILDLASARQLGLTSNGRAARGTSGPPQPAPSNLYLAPGSVSPEALMADIGEGLLVSELIGMGVNGITGDYSRGAAGFMIRHGAIAEPVAEITIAGNLIDMFATLTPADDLRFRRGIDSPSVRVEGLTMAGG